MRHALLLAVLAAPAAAQDVSTQFLDAARAFTLPGSPSLNVMDFMDDEPILELLPTLEGTWAAASALQSDIAPLDPALLAEGCTAGRALTLTAIAPRSFEIRRQRQGEDGPLTLTVRYDWMMGNIFDRGVAEAELTSFLGLDPLDLPPGGLALQARQARGLAHLFHPSPDILVSLGSDGAPELYARCR